MSKYNHGFPVAPDKVHDDKVEQVACGEGWPYPYASDIGDGQDGEKVAVFGIDVFDIVDDVDDEEGNADEGDDGEGVAE